MQLSKEAYARKRIYNGSLVQIENSVTRVTVRHHSASLVMPNNYPRDGIFNQHLTTSQKKDTQGIPPLKRKNGKGVAQSDLEKAEEFNGQFTDVFNKNEQSKKISNDQELIQSDPISCPQNQKGNN